VGSNYSVFMRGMDGSPCGTARQRAAFPSLSPDSKWVAALDNGSPDQLELLPHRNRPATATYQRFSGTRWGALGTGRQKRWCSPPSEPKPSPAFLLDEPRRRKSPRAITPEGNLRGRWSHPMGKIPAGP